MNKFPIIGAYLGGFGGLFCLFYWLFEQTSRDDLLAIAILGLWISSISFTVWFVEYENEKKG